MEESLSIEPVVRKKPGPAAKPKIDVEDLLRRIDNLEELIIRMAHNSGVSHILLKKAGLSPYVATKNDMQKFRG